MQNYSIHLVENDHPDFLLLVEKLTYELAERDGEDHAFYQQYNGLEELNCCVVLYFEGIPVSCGACKPMGSDAMEIKRIYTLPDYRRKGLAGRVLAALELWAYDVGISYARLETGKRQPESIAVYKKLGYQVIDNFPPYEGIGTVSVLRKTSPYSEILQHLTKPFKR